MQWGEGSHSIWLQSILHFCMDFELKALGLEPQRHTGLGEGEPGSPVFSTSKTVWLPGIRPELLGEAAPTLNPKP